jgi:hypothetical protein
MLAALNQHCRPDLVANAFTTLLSLFNDSMGASEKIMVSAPGSMEWSTTWPILKSIFLQYSMRCSSSALSTVATMTSLNNFAPITNPLRVPPLIQLWQTSANTTTLSWSGRIRNFLWPKLLRRRLLLPPLKRINRERSGTTHMNGLPPSTSKA